MSPPRDPARPDDARRDFLRLAVLAPAALAACATSGANARPERNGAKTSAGASAPDEGPSAADAIRAVPLGMDVEPAFVFRAGRGE
jgi:hypothetical protein